MSLTSQREITDHKTNGLNNCIRVMAIGEPGPGGANQVYELALVDGERPRDGSPDHWQIKFQNGNPAGNINGISNEALIAIVIDRLRGVQGLNPIVEGGQLPAAKAPFACRENALALTHFQEGLMWLQKRTRDRQERGVEGQQKV